MGKVISTLITVVVAVGASAAVWLLANMLFSQARLHWARFRVISAALLGFVLGVILAGNRVTRGSEGGFVNWVWLPLLLAVVFGAVTMLLANTGDQRQRLVLGVVAGAAVGVGLGALVRPEYQPALEILPLLGWTAAGVAVGAVVSALRKRLAPSAVLLGGAIGWVLGSWGSAELGTGSTVEAIVAMTVPALAIGARSGLSTTPSKPQRDELEQRSRAVIFLAPALLFIFVTLVIPTFRTIYLSFLDRDSEEFVGIDNYSETFRDPDTWDTSNWTNMFTSRLFVIGIVLLVIAVITGVTVKKRTGRAVEVGNPTIAPLVVGGMLVAIALFTAVRGTISNNLWWVVTVTFLSTGIGLAVAVLADGRRGEKGAKSVIFMPMAISLVGAAVIWRFMYVPRDTSQEQTGVMNALWVGLGRLSTGSGLPTIIVGIVLALALAGLLALVGRAFVRQKYGGAIVPGIAAILLGWFFVRYVGSGVGGFTTNAGGEIVPQTIGFIQESPFNNMWLMVVLIWIQTGFAMVILSAAIKAVPQEYIEAARVDGATTSQVFWRITLPQIATTIGVVVTTLIVLVMKVFDIVKVTTNGNFETQVLANDMYNQAFSAGNIGRGAALAVILFLSVLPVMFFNIRRMQRES